MIHLFDESATDLVDLADARALAAAQEQLRIAAHGHRRAARRKLEAELMRQLQRGTMQ